MILSSPLTQVQYGLYVECQNHKGELCYNVPYLYILDARLDGERLCRAIETVIASHPVFFTRIRVNDDGDPIQVIDTDETVTVSIEPVNRPSREDFIGMLKPFDIEGDRLFHVNLLKDDEHYYLLWDCHHIINDGTSLKLFLRDLQTAYLGEEIEAEELSMRDVACEENEKMSSDAHETDKQWYIDNFDCSDVFTTLIPDLEGEEAGEDSVLREMSVTVDEVDAFCKQNGVFKSNLFNTSYAYLLARISGTDQAVCYTAYNGRADKRLKNSIGMFVHTLPIYCKFNADTSVLDLLINGQEQMKSCRVHGAYSFGELTLEQGVQADNLFLYNGELFAKTEFGGYPLTTTRVVNSWSTTTHFTVKCFIQEGRYYLKAEYASNLYSKALMESLLESLEMTVKGMMTHKLLSDIDITSPGQTQVLDSFNDHEMEYDRTQTVVSLFRRQAAATPQNVAVVYKDKTYTYAETDELSDRLAAYIAAQGLGREDVVSVLIPRSEWMAIASLGVLKAGCAYQPLDPSYPPERLNFMMQDAAAKLLIADNDLRHLVDEYNGPVLSIADIPSLPHADTLPDEPTPDDLFILLYTSGSTGVPKGCQLEHGNLNAFCSWSHHYFAMTEKNVVAAYASYGFDACMADLYPALTIGAAVHIIPEEIRLDLIAINDYLERNGVTNFFMTTQVAYQFATTIENHSLKHLITGGEKLAGLTPPDNYVLHNAYGPTECTIYVTTFPVKQAMKEIPIGKALKNVRLYVVDPQGRRQPVGATGELWISGPQVSRGYLNRPEKTAEVYIDNPFTDDEKYRRVYRTGDIVRYLPSGDIQFVGRRDGQVKIRGFRIELKEVEGIIRQFPGIKDATVQAFDEDGGGKFIAAYIVSDETINIEELNNFILDEKPPYMVPAVTMQIESIPLNQNQKVNKRALPKPEKKAAEQEAVNAPMNVLEQELHEIISGIVNSTEFTITTPLGYAGLTSISAIKLAVQVSKKYDVKLDSKWLVKAATLQLIENEILERMLHREQEVEAVKTETPAVSEAPLSFAQTGVYYECLKNPTSTIYNIPYLLSFPAGTEAEKLAEAVKKVYKAHPALAGRIEMRGDTPTLTIVGSPELEVPVKQMNVDELNDYKRDFVRPFNLQKAPLCRFEVVQTDDGTTTLLIDVHHLVFDGGSTDLFIRQLCSILEGNDIEPEQYTYLNFCADQKNAEQSPEFIAAKDFFAKKLERCESASEISADLSAATQGFIGETVVPVNHDSVAQFCRTHNITPAHLFFAATSYVVSRFTNNRDVYLCTVSGGRSNLQIADTVGMFVNTLALGVTVDDVTVEQFLRQAADTFDETLTHENYPLARVAADYGFRPAIAYAYQVGVMQEYRVNGQVIGQELLELNVPKFKINIKIETRGVVVQYDDALYTPALAETLAQSIAAVASRLTTDTNARVRSLSIISDEQERQLADLRQTDTAEAPFHLFHHAVEHWAEVQPNQPALVACDAQFSYAEFNEATWRIARALRKRGVQPRDRVALLLPRTSRLVLAMFGVMKAGAAYIPCDPEYPADRVKLILEDSGAQFIITTTDNVTDDTRVDVETLLEETDATPVVSDITGDDLAYLIYTSGSTGRPKGVMLRHEGICNYLYGHPANVFAHAVATDATRVLSVTTISFDAALQDIGTALYSGKTLVVATEEQANNPLDLAQLIEQQHVDMVSGTPSRWMTWLTSDVFGKAISNIKIARAGGEKFSSQLLEALRSTTKARIFNCYGPTEITVASNNAELTHAKLITVGKPQLNVKEFIVDPDGNELPVGVVGELFIGGRGVGRGYNNLDEMTAERFINYHGERVYRSGDYAKWLADGNVVILGRTDNQIKLRGLRIELGEIENVMLKVDGVQKVVILIRKINGKEHLCAYYTASRAIDGESMKQEIAKSLTQYMVPTAYLQLDSMPMTPNGKTDVKALPEPQLASAGEYEAPATDTERVFADIFADILQMDRVGANDNFFDLGGTSLVVTRVIIEADKAGHHVAYGDVFDNPTPRMLARLVTGETVDETKDDNDVSNFDYSAIDRVLSEGTLDAFRNGEHQPLGNVLLTGATGFLGIHILRELIDSEAKTIHCLVRGKELAKAESRLKTLLFYYFDNSFEELFANGRLNVVLGDVTQDFDAQLKVDTIFNCAAIVKHFAEGTEIEDVNIGGAQRCVDYCLAHGARLVHISTASTRGLSVGGHPAPHDVFTEQRFYMGQFLGNKYIYSKFIAERLILDAVARQGLNAKIMRVGNLAARSTDGEFQMNFNTNSFMGRIRIYNMLGCCPYAMRNKRVEFSPINEVSRAIVLLASTPKACCVFHPYNNHSQLLGDVLEGLNNVTGGIRFVEQEEFNNAMEQAGADPVKAAQLSGLLAYQDMAHGQKTADVERDNDYTTQVLYRLNYVWNPTSWDYVERMLVAISGLGFFE